MPPPPPKKGSGSLVSSKKRILNSRNNSSAPNVQPMNSPAILNQVTTSNNQDIRPYWNGQVAKWSQKLWLPTDSAASPSTLSSIYSFSILQNSWFSSMMRPLTSTNFPKISLPLSAECKEEEQLCTEENGKRKITKTINTRSKKKRKPKQIGRAHV